LNDDFTNEQAAAMAARLLREAGPLPDRQVERAYWLALSRPPTDGERRLGLAFLRAQQEQHKRAGARDPCAAALTDLCVVLFNANEFVYVD
jgi:hypothetical protein